ncbi:MAG TPA: carboxypeptidase-like regulatory domain-containing protein [Solirubrobacterales bacterium]|nr:carboxypeptidase-like regulatory domain-containing protein [Solirubrobacterales bacterium]
MGRPGKALPAPIIALCALVLLAPGTAAAATISGTVSDENTHLGLGGIEVCPTPQPYTFEVACVGTDSGGHYSLTGLPPAQYVLHFSARVGNPRYVDEYYDDTILFEEADLVTLGSADDSRQIDAELAEGGTVTGTLTDEATKAPVEGMAACAWPPGGFYQRCDFSGADGFYEIEGLPSGDYVVEYDGWDRVNYIREFYEDAENLAQATDVSVLAPATVSGIDDEVARGAEILGHVSETSSGAPVEGAMVCAPLASAGEDDFNTNCNWTDASGNYAIRGLRAGTYVVGFDLEFGGGPFGGLTVGQWWKEVATRSEATPLELTTPQTVTGIDGKASRPYRPPALPETEPAATPPPLAAPLLRSPRLPAKKCRKGFHRKLVKGKKRCVRKHRHHRRHHRSRR